jgi:formamidopyrimidine-DNA glycosylase
VPELPEVETIVRDLRRLVTGSTIARAKVLRPDLIERASAREFESAVRGATIRGITRRAKNIVFDFGENRLVVNLGMTGRMLLVRPDDTDPPHVGVRFTLKDGRILLYHDVRRFGRLEVCSASDWAERDAALGYEPLGDEFTPLALHELAGRSKVAVKTWLMDQRRIVGVGNIYASEALHRAAIDPRKPANRLSRAKAAALHDAIRETLTEAIEHRGTTLLDYRDAAGEQGGFAVRLRVYDREGEPCPRCGARIKRIVQGGRSTFYCGKCQR